MFTRASRGVKALAGSRSVKAILETGQLQGADMIREAGTLALDAGADFLKTSTGKVPVGATPEAVRTLLELIAARGSDAGVKASGGVRTLEDAETYLAIADEVMGADWASPKTFRFGASGLLTALIDALDGRAPATPGTGY